MADGSIIIETGLDNTGLEQGIQAMQQTMQRAVTEMQNQLRNLGNDSNLFQIYKVQCKMLEQQQDNNYQVL